MSTNLGFTGLHPKTILRIKKLHRIIADKLKPWKEMHIKKRLNVKDYSGRAISYAGVSLRGTPMLVLWNNFIEPFLENGIDDILENTYQMCAEKNLDSHIYMKEASAVLKSLNRKTYESMGELCCKSRNRGFPKGVTPVNVEEKIKYMNRFVDSYATAILNEGKVLDNTVSNKTIKLDVKDASLFPTPNDAKWPDVKITFVDDNHVDIKAKGITKNKIHFSKMGFEYRKTGRETKLWRTLRTFALSEGTIPPKVDRQGKIVKIVSPDDVKRLKNKLASYFSITGNSISYIKAKWVKGNYIKAEGYKTAFHIIDKTYLTK